MGQTTKHGLRYPENTDLVKETATYIKNLAEDTDTALTNQIIQESGSAKTTNTYSATAINNKIKTNVIVGAESETNEYIDGKRIFVKRVSAGNLPNAGRLEIDTGIKLDTTTIYKIEGMARISNIIYPLPYLSLANSLGDLGDNSVSLFLQEQNSTTGTWKVTMTTQSDRSAYEAFVNIYYTKN